MKQTLRDYQHRAIDLLRQEFKKGHKRVLLTVATGSGKTTIASAIAQSSLMKGKRIIFVAHRQEIIYQIHSRLAKHGIDSGIIMNGHPTEDKPVQVASVQTLIRRVHPPADVIIFDECHHIISSSWAGIAKNYNYIIGLTATPWREDTKSLGDIFQSIVCPITMQELIDQGYLVQPRYFGAKQDFSDIKVVRGDYDNQQLFRKVDKKMLYDGVVDKFKQFGVGKALVFCINIEHSKNTINTFKLAGYKGEHIDCDTDKKERKKILDDFKAGEYDILSNCSLFTEGTDIPDVGTIILNRATKSKSLYFQMVGRGLRTVEGKKHCTVIDHGNNVYEHGIVEADIEYSLLPKKKSRSMGEEIEPQVKECPECSSLVGVRTLVCKHCGHIFPIEEKEIELKEAEFEEIKTQRVIIPPHLRKRWTDMSDGELEEYRVLKGYKIGWKHYIRKQRNEISKTLNNFLESHTEALNV